MKDPAAFGPLDVALVVAAAIETVGGHYFVGGSIASSMQGEPRATNDIDFVLELPLGRIQNLRAALGSDFELDVDMLREASAPPAPQTHSICRASRRSISSVARTRTTTSRSFRDAGPSS